MSEIRDRVIGEIKDDIEWFLKYPNVYQGNVDTLIKEILSVKELAIVDRDAELPDCFYDSLIFPTTIEEAGKFLTDKGLTDRDKSAVSGTIARLGWENCVKELLEAGYVKEVK